MVVGAVAFTQGASGCVRTEPAAAAAAVMMHQLYSPVPNERSPITLAPDFANYDTSWLDGVQGILRDGSLSAVFDYVNGGYGEGKRNYGWTGSGQNPFDLRFNYFGDPEEVGYGVAIPIHPYCVKELRQALEDDGLTLGQAYRFYIDKCAPYGYFESPAGAKNPYGPLRYLVEDKHYSDNVPVILLHRPEDIWVLAPYSLQDLPPAPAGSPAVVTRVIRPSSQGKTDHPLATLPDEILFMILELLRDINYLEGNAGLRGVVALQSSCMAIRARLMAPHIAEYYWKYYLGESFWTATRIQLESGRLLEKPDPTDEAARQEFMAHGDKLHLWKIVSNWMKSPSARNRRRILGLYNAYLPTMRQYLEDSEEGLDFVWEGP
ncbi:hypothetical protein HDU88_006368 [Geranomyces variabilis]|nr:hypothetical protein HDU88_006368 [Geranomyces variabilis]